MGRRTTKSVCENNGGVLVGNPLSPKGPKGLVTMQTAELARVPLSATFSFSGRARQRQRLRSHWGILVGLTVELVPKGKRKVMEKMMNVYVVTLRLVNPAVINVTPIRVFQNHPWAPRKSIWLLGQTQAPPPEEVRESSCRAVYAWKLGVCVPLRDG